MVHYSPVKELSSRSGCLHRKHSEEEAAKIKKKVEAQSAFKAARAAKKKVTAKEDKDAKNEGKTEISAAGMDGVVKLQRQMLEK